VGIKKKQLFRKVTILLMATCLFHQHGRMECWNVGVLGIKVEEKHYNCKKLLLTH